jgi:hypothetical protein
LTVLLGCTVSRPAEARSFDLKNTQTAHLFACRDAAADAVIDTRFEKISMVRDNRVTNATVIKSGQKYEIDITCFSPTNSRVFVSVSTKDGDQKKMEKFITEKLKTKFYEIIKNY